MKEIDGGSGEIKEQSVETGVDFTLSVDELAQALQGKIIATIGEDGTMGNAVLLTDPQPYGLEQTETHPAIGERYRRAFSTPAVGLVPGSIWAAPQRAIRQTLISSLDNHERGACVRIHRASSVNLSTGEATPLPTEGAIAEALGLDKNAIARLQVTDNPFVLTLERTDSVYDSSQTEVNKTARSATIFFEQFVVKNKDTS